MRSLVLGSCVAGLVGCGGSSGSPAPLHTGTVAASTAIDLYPSSSSGNRLFVMVTSVGTATVNLPLIFDTGSAGVTLNALAILPANMVSAAGFVFPAGQTSMSYQGITVTNQQGTRTFGGAAGTTQNGNLGFATVTFGDAAGKLTTDVIPVFLYYSVTRTATGAPVTGQPQQGIFGVNAAPNVVNITGSSVTAAAAPACAQDTSGTCFAISPLKYLHYGSGVNAGFMLTPVTLQPCEIGTPGACAGTPVLTIGLTAGLEAGFSTVSLNCPPPSYSGPATANGYPVCQQAIPNSTITLSLTESGSTVVPVLFDTGTPFMEIRLTSGSSFPTAVPSGTDVMVMLPSGFSYSFTAGAGVAAANIDPTGSGSTIVGIGYFTTNSYFVDFTTSTAGWK